MLSFPLYPASLACSTRFTSFASICYGFVWHEPQRFWLICSRSSSHSPAGLFHRLSLSRCASRGTGTQKQCAELAHEVGTTLVAIKELANRADLMRLHGVGGNFSNMLVEVGVTSCRELQHYIPEKLHTQLEKISIDKQIGHRVPTLAQTTQWIIEAKALAAGKSTDRQVYQNTADLLVDEKARASAADQLLSSAEAEAEKQRLSTEKQAAKDA